MTIDSERPRRSRMLALATALAATLLLVGAPLRALADEYEDYTPTPVAKEITAPTAVIIAYAAIWLLVCAYAVSLWIRQRRVSSEIEQVERRLDDLTSRERSRGQS